MVQRQVGGWFNIAKNDATGLFYNLVYPQGLYWQSRSGRQDAHPSRIKIEYQQIDNNNVPFGAIYSNEFYILIGSSRSLVSRSPLIFRLLAHSDSVLHV